MAVRSAAGVVSLTLFTIIRAYSVKKMFFFCPFVVFKPYEYINFVSKS